MNLVPLRNNLQAARQTSFGYGKLTLTIEQMAGSNECGDKPSDSIK
jgi:hypothetical protein